MDREFHASAILNSQVKPRILIMVRSPSLFAWANDLPGTTKFITSISEVDPNEWDAIITTEPLVSTSFLPPKSIPDWADYASVNIPGNLMVFSIFPAKSFSVATSILNIGPKLPPEDGEASHIQLKGGVPGNEVKQVTHLPESIQEIVKSSLVPVVSTRREQYGFMRTSDQTLAKSGLKSFRPFLFGPQDLVLAGSFEKLNGVSVWVIPNDIPNIPEWFDLALMEWHTFKPKSFPGIGVWQKSSAWFTNDEKLIQNKILEAQTEFSAQEVEYRNELERLNGLLEAASENSDIGRKRLLWAQDTPLQVAVLDALCDIGFLVTDMDLIWKEKELREDYRIEDPDEAGWLVLGDATGVTAGAKGSKIPIMQGYVTKYVLDERPETAPGIWIFVNHLIDRDPESRGDIYRQDDLDVLTSHKGLAIATSGVFLLVEACSEDPNKSRELRRWLRLSTGQITLEIARDWLTHKGWMNS